MKVNINNKLNKAIDSLIPVSPISLNKKVVFFLEEGFTPDELGYLHKGDKYIRIIKNGITITNKDKVWKDGVVIDSSMNLLHIDD